MATRSNTTRRRAQATNLLTKAQNETDDLTRSIFVLAKVLSETLVKLHGGTWDVHIDHVSQMVAVSRNFPPEHAIRPSQLREVV